MPRYKSDLHSITKAGRLSQKHFLIVASQIIDVLMTLHSKHYVHSDIKAENIMIGSRGSTFSKYENKNGKETKSSTIQFGGANPLRSCRMKDPLENHLWNNTSRSHYLRPGRSVAYSVDEDSKSSHAHESEISDDSRGDEDFQLSPRKRKARRQLNKAKGKRNGSRSPVKNVAPLVAKNLLNKQLDPPPPATSDDRVYVIDYGLATKFIDTNGEHKPFCMDQRRAHDGTLEFTSRDAHFGAHSRRSDLECLGYNLIYWSQGYLPWKDEKLKEQPEIVHRLKEIFMTDVKEILKLLYGKEVPRYLGEFLCYVSQLEFDQEPDYGYLKGLFEKEMVKLGYTESDMILNLSEMRDQCQPGDKNMTESELMISTITDLKTARKLGFLIATECIDGTETQAKQNESISLNIACKASPKNLRSKEKTKGKRPKRQPKITEKELICEKMAQGKKLSIAEIATLDPDKIAKDRADREYEKFDERVYYQTPQRYKGHPTYAILEIQNRLKNKLNGSAAAVASGESEPIIKGYTKPMMDVLKKQQMLVEQQITPTTTAQPVKRSREGLRNVITPSKKNLIYKNVIIQKKRGRKTRKSVKDKPQECEEALVVEERFGVLAESEKVEEVETVPEPPRRKRGRPKRKRALKVKAAPVVQTKCDDSTNDVNEVEPPIKRKRGRPRIIRNVIEPPETEEDSVYYDIPGEGSNDGVKEISEDENEPEIISHKRSSRRVTPSDDNSNQSVASGSITHVKKARSQYYADDDYDASTDEVTNISSATQSSSVSVKPRRGRQGMGQDDGISTRNKIKSRSTSRSGAVFSEATDLSECSDAADNDSEYQAQSEEEEEVEEQGLEYTHSETEEEASESETVDDESNESDDSIDIKYSPIKTRHTRRAFSIKHIRGRIISFAIVVHDI